MTFLMVLRREIRGLVALPQTYAIAAAYLIISGVFFVNLLVSTQIPDLNLYYSNIASTLIVLVPIVSMRSFAEERRTGALDLILAYPLTRTGLVLGKFVANTIYVWVLVSVSWLYVRLLSEIASIDGARAAGGYIGMLLLAAAFSALTLMVSARASTPTGAAFMGFGLLLLLWILEYAPGFVRDFFRALAPAVRFESFPRGVLFFEDVGYFVLVTLAGLSMAVQALGRHRPGPAAGSLIRRGAVLAAVAVVLAGTPAMARNLEGEIDLTEGKRNTISPATRDVLRSVTVPIHLTAFVRPISVEATNLRNIVKQYRSAGADIRVTTIDPDTQPGLARKFDVREYNQYIIELKGRSEMLDNLNQVEFSSALNRLRRQRPPLACATIGHGERDVEDPTVQGISGVRKQLFQLGYEVRSLALAGPGGADILETCDLLMIIGPRTGFADGELQMIGDFAADNGRLVIAPDGVEGPHDQIDQLLRPWGLSFTAAVVHDVSSVADDPTAVVSFDFPSKSPVVADLDLDNVPVVFTNGVAVEEIALGEDDAEEEAYISHLVRSSHKSWIEDRDGRPLARGPFMLAAISDLSRITGSGRASDLDVTRIGVVGSADAFSNRFLSVWGNRQFTSALLQWVGEEEDIITANRDPGGVYKLILTRAQRNDLLKRGIAYPTLAVLVPLPIAFFRLKRG